MFVFVVINKKNISAAFTVYVILLHTEYNSVTFTQVHKYTSPFIKMKNNNILIEIIQNIL